jgi:hypothetical protein
MVRQTAILTGRLAALAIPVAAAEGYTVHDCTFALRGTGGEQSRLVIAIDAEGRSVTDEAVRGAERPKRVPVKLRKDRADHCVVTHTFNTPHPDTGTVRVDARARMPRDGGSARISPQGRGDTKGPSGDGTCKLERNVRLPQ